MDYFLPTKNGIDRVGKGVAHRVRVHGIYTDIKTWKLFNTFIQSTTIFVVQKIEEVRRGKSETKTV